jgi:hypothetical protein
VTFGAEFLVEPDLFPGRASGEAWGGERLRLDIAGGPYALAGLAAPQRDTLAAWFAPRGLADGPAADDVAVRIFRAPESDFRDFPLIGWQTRLDLDPAERSVRVAGRRFVGRLDWAERLAAALWTSSDADADLPGIVENFLRVVVAHRAVEEGGALLHSAAVVAEGRAFVFFGASGAGKSTLCGLSAERGFEVLSDELNALIEGAGGVEVERLPFAGDHGRSAGERRRYPLGGLVALAQGSPPARRPIARARAVAALRLLATLDRLTAARPVETLVFGLDPGFWDIVLGTP